MFLKISPNSQQNTRARVSFLNKVDRFILWRNWKLSEKDLDSNFFPNINNLWPRDYTLISAIKFCWNAVKQSSCTAYLQHTILRKQKKNKIFLNIFNNLAFGFHIFNYRRFWVAISKISVLLQHVYSFFIYQGISLLTLSWRRPLSYRNQSIDLLRKSMNWFLYDNGLRHERVKLRHVRLYAFISICCMLHKYIEFDQDFLWLLVLIYYSFSCKLYPGRQVFGLFWDGVFLQKHIF